MLSGWPTHWPQEGDKLRAYLAEAQASLAAREKELAAVTVTQVWEGSG